MAVLSLMVASACAATPTAELSTQQQERLALLGPASALLLGEQHDAPEHQQTEQAVVQALTRTGRLGSLLLEMADQGRDTSQQAPDASEEAVQRALDWPEGWPWAQYGPVVMAAVSAGVPVFGANLPRSQMRGAMQDSTLDAALSPGTLEGLKHIIEESHCHLLPANQLDGMVRIQVARDRSMAMALTQALQRSPDKVVLLVAGYQHTRRDQGIPLHVPPDTRLLVTVMQASPPPGPSPVQLGLDPERDTVWLTPPLEPEDHCAALRQQLFKRAERQ